MLTGELGRLCGESNYVSNVATAVILWRYIF
ncbi:hypothetical protein CPS_1628 [Colwellia psychrerythraea 34H]|uniref:Uncharacterized protein n=1 Tax=Colwellia psychrerythraea (strain 34H / ATCC BAA-681) TaxID=167879 RepID=Q484Z9_COLP3|nr:hypothetical protein CPS_1628 [Colwellia psychrerythraea 34H]